MDDTKLGKKLLELTTRMVMTLVLAFMLTVPLFTVSTWNDDSEKFTYGLRLVSEFYPNSSITEVVDFRRLQDSNGSVPNSSESVFNITMQSYI